MPDIAVCVCTYQRPQLLRRLMGELDRQDTQAHFNHSIVIVDNDSVASARSTVEEFASSSRVPVSYYVEPEQNIALARNKAVANSGADLVAFIDDDEIAPPEWLARLYAALVDHNADGILGPVRPRFDTPPPRWLQRAAVLERPVHATGSTLHWSQTRTGNVLIRRRALDAVEGPFRPEFGGGGEDCDFFQRATAAGFTFVWCEEAAVDEVVPPERMRLSFQLRRALLRGKASAALRSRDRFSVLKSVVACAGYTMVLPFLPLAGRHVFVKYLISDFDHLGKLLAVCGLDVVGSKYIVK